MLEDLGTGKPMDRLICGDVGFGKTEVALRAAFVVAMTGKQVAIVVPTTLLARQHFRPSPSASPAGRSRIGELSRLVPRKDAKQIEAGLADGTIDIVVGTHALLAKDVEFKRPRPGDRRRGAALRRHAQGAAEEASAPTSTC